MPAHIVMAFKIKNISVFNVHLKTIRSLTVT